MNKIISTKARVFISLVGPSGSGKSHLIFDWLKIGTIQQSLTKFLIFINIINLSMGKCTEKILTLFKELTLN